MPLEHTLRCHGQAGAALEARRVLNADGAVGLDRVHLCRADALEQSASTSGASEFLIDLDVGFFLIQVVGVPSQAGGRGHSR